MMTTKEFKEYVKMRKARLTTVCRNNNPAAVTL